MRDDRNIAVVTGAGQGLGRAISMNLAESGLHVVMTDVNGDQVESAAADIRATGGSASALAGDVSDEATVAAWIDAVGRLPGKLHVWVNNAGISRPAMLHKMTMEQFDSVVAVHVRGTYLGIREATRYMIAADVPGSIINLTSSAGLQGTIGQINYAAAKGAITAMTKSAAKELGRYGIRVNAIAPLAATQMTETLQSDRFRDQFLRQVPLGRFGDTADAARLVGFLVSDAASFITGQTVCVDGGLYLAS